MTTTQGPAPQTLVKTRTEAQANADALAATDRRLQTFHMSSLKTVVVFRTKAFLHRFTYEVDQ